MDNTSYSFNEVNVEHDCKHEDKIIELCENVATLVQKVEEPMKAIDKHINHGHVWRTAVAGLTLTVIINVVVFANMYGTLTQRVKDNESHIDRLININERISILEEKVSFLEDIVVMPLIEEE